MVRLGDIATVITKGTTPTSVGFQFQNTGVNFIRIESITEDGTFLPEKFGHIDSVCNEALKRSQLRNNDILFSIAGAIGRTAIVNESILPANTNQALAIIRIPEGVVNYKFILYALQAPSVKEQFSMQKQGVAQLNISLKNVSDFKVPMVSICRQEHIVAVLDSVNHMIALRKQQLAKLDELVKARFVEMFGDPETNPMSWQKCPLSSVIINANNGMARRGNDPDGSIVMRLVELQDGYINYAVPNRIVLTDTEKRRYLLRDGDFLFARVNGNPENVGRCAVFSEIGEPVYHNDHIIRVHFDDTVINGAFASTLFNSKYGKLQMRGQIKTSAGQYTISQDGIGSIIAILPPLELQNQFASFVTQVNKSKLTIQQSLDKLEVLKKALMQKYFG